MVAVTFTRMAGVGAAYQKETAMNCVSLMPSRPFDSDCGGLSGENLPAPMGIGMERASVPSG